MNYDSSFSGEMASALSAFQSAAKSFPQLSPSQQLEFAEEIRQLSLSVDRIADSGGEVPFKLLARRDQLVEHLCVSCWRLAWVIVREQAESRYGREKARDHLPDLMSEANAALVKAAYSFDGSMTPKFATYAARVVRDHIRAVLSREGYMRLAPSWGRVKRIAATRLPELTAALGRAPSTEELQSDLLERCLEWAYGRLEADDLALPPEPKRRAAMAKLRKQGMLGAIRDIEEVLVASQSVLSLDQPTSEDGSWSLGDSVKDDSWDAGYHSAEMSGLQDALREALEPLSSRERRIVLLRYGFDGSEGWTYGRIAEEFGVSSERIRQIERSALEKLSAGAASSQLQEFLA